MRYPFGRILMALHAAAFAAAQPTARSNNSLVQRPPRCVTKLPHRRIPGFTVNGSYVLTTCDKVHTFDAGLATELLHRLLDRRRVLELGAGCGCYSSFFRSNATRIELTALDGTKNIAALTHGHVSTVPHARK